MRKYGKWAVALIIAGILGAGLAQVGVTMSENQQAAAKAAAVAAAPAPNCGGGCGGAEGSCASKPKASGCPMMQGKGDAHAATTDVHAKSGGCPMMAGKAASTESAKCPAKEAGNDCTDCTQHKGCPDAKATKTDKPASADTPAASDKTQSK